MERCRKPIIGAISGFAITAGFEISLACEDAEFIDTHARWRNINPVAVGWLSGHPCSIGPPPHHRYPTIRFRPSKILHWVIKTANILLDFNFGPKVADFGLAKITSDVATHVSTRVIGTFEYLAPEYAASSLLGYLSFFIEIPEDDTNITQGPTENPDLAVKTLFSTSATKPDSRENVVKKAIPDEDESEGNAPNGGILISIGVHKTT